MPVRHGLHRKLPTPGTQVTVKTGACFKYGIRNVFHSLAYDNILKTPSEVTLARQIDRHFTTSCERFLFALQEMNTNLQLLVGEYEVHGDLRGSRPGFLKAGCFADQALSCLGLIVDDLAILISICTGLVNEHPIDSMGKLRSLACHASLAPVKSLMDDLGEPDSWWALGFRPKQGVRQLLIHNHHCVEFQVISVPNQSPWIDVSLLSPYSDLERVSFTDYAAILRNILTKLFNWLDRLEEVLKIHLKTTFDKEVALTHPQIILPVGYEIGKTTYLESYFPIPRCEDADPLPWTIDVIGNADGMLLKNI